MRDDVASLPRAAYFVAPAAKAKGEEPASYAALPEASVTRAAVAYLLSRKRFTLHEGEAVGSAPLAQDRAKEVLALLAGPFERPLPPFDWLLLDGLPCREALLKVAARQCQHSRQEKSLHSLLRTFLDQPWTWFWVKCLACPLLNLSAPQ